MTTVPSSVVELSADSRSSGSSTVAHVEGRSERWAAMRAAISSSRASAVATNVMGDEPDDASPDRQGRLPAAGAADEQGQHQKSIPLASRIPAS